MRHYLIFFLLAGSVARADLDLLSNDELSAVAGGDGVAVGLDWRINADASGTPLSLCTAAATYKECRIALAFSNRGTDDVNKKWLVFKGVSGALKVPYMSLDASTVSYTTDTGGSNTLPAALIGFGDANTKIQVKNLLIDNISVEQDSSARRGYEADSACEPSGTGTGVCAGIGANIPANVNTGFLTLQMAGPGNIANIRIEGTVKLFSCLGNHPSC